MNNSTREPINRLNPTKCPFCSPSTLACGWSGHKREVPTPPTPPAIMRATIYQVSALAYYPEGQRRVKLCVRSSEDIGEALRSSHGDADFREIEVVELPLYHGPSVD